VLVATGAPGNFGPATSIPTQDTRWAGGGRLQRGRRPDLATIFRQGFSIAVLLASGHPATSGQPRSFPVGDPPHSQTTWWKTLAVADFNGDARLDLAGANPNASKVSVLLPSGPPAASGQPANFPVIPLTRSVIQRGRCSRPDRGRSVRPHLPVYNLSIVAVLLATGPPGNFGQYDLSTADRPNSLEVVDLNGDGRLDLTTADYDYNTISCCSPVAHQAASARPPHSL